MLRRIAIPLAASLSLLLAPEICAARDPILMIADNRPASGAAAMPLDEFWMLIEKIDRTALNMGEGFDRQAVAPLYLALSNYSEEQLKAFDERMAQLLFALDGRRFSDVNGGSADGFLYARAYVVAMGRKYYESVLRDPSLMPSSIEQWCEPLLLVARDTWRKSTGRDLNYEPSVSFESGSNTSQW